MHVSGPGPREPPKESADKPVPPAPHGNGSDTDLIDASDSGEHGDDDGEGEGEEDYIGTRTSTSADPYANLDSAFGAYTADQPKPQTDDLLF